MIKTNLRIKDKITFEDKMNATTTILNWMFENETYEPWYKEPARIWAICNHFLEGIEFEETDAFLDIYEEDEELQSLVDVFLYETENENYEKYYSIMESVDETVEKAEKYTCDLIINSIQRYDLSRIVEACNVVIESLGNYSKLTFDGLSEEEINNVTSFIGKMKDMDISPESFSNILKDAVGIDWDEKASEVIESKNEQIRELQSQLDTIKATLNI